VVCETVLPHKGSGKNPASWAFRMSSSSLGAMDDSVGAKNFSPLQPGQRPRGTAKTIGSVICGFKIGVAGWMSNAPHTLQDLGFAQK